MIFMVPSSPTPVLGCSLLGGAVLAAEQCRGGRAGRAGAGHTGQLWKEHCAGGHPAAALAGVASCSCPRCFSTLGKLQVRNSLGAASQGGLRCSWGFCPCLGVGKALSTPHLSLPGRSLQDSLLWSPSESPTPGCHSM